MKKNKKVGILTFHYSQNYGGTLQCIALSKAIEKQGYDVEIINYIPERYNPDILHTIGLNKNIRSMKIKDLNPIVLSKKIKLKRKYSQELINKFNAFRNNQIKLSEQVNERTIMSLVNKYDLIVVGSDQVWNPSERKKNIYFLNFNNTYKGKKLSYAADSTIKEYELTQKNNLQRALLDFDYISVRNNHTQEFTESLIEKKVDIVADPTLLYNFEDIKVDRIIKAPYIIAYVLGEEIEGSHQKVIQKIRNTYGDIPVYFIVITTTNFKFYNCADKVFYNLGPEEWLSMIKYATFVYTDSYHGTLFAMKYHKPFLAYYKESMRATRFIDIAERYKISEYIVSSVADMEMKKSIETLIDYKRIDELLEKHKNFSEDLLIKKLELD